MRNLSKLTALTLAALVLLPGLRAIAAKPQDIESFVRDFVAERMDEANVPGMVFAYVDADGIAYSEAFGLADVGTGRPMTTDTPLRVGSISKPVTSALAFELAASGVIDLDTPVDAYLDRDLSDRYGEASSVRSLLQHLGGYPDAIVGSHHLESNDALTLEEWAQQLGDRSIAPDVVASYTSVGYTLAGAAMEQASGMSFSEVARDVVFDAVGMNNASFSQTVPTNVAIGYSWNGTFEHYPTDYPDLVPGAGLVASVTDIGRFMFALLDADGPFDPSTREGLLTRIGPEPGLRGYTTGLTEWVYDSRSVLYHEGNGIGTSNRMILLPDEGVGIFTSVNAETMIGQGDPSTQLLFMRELQEQLVARFFPTQASTDDTTPRELAGTPTDDVDGVYISTRVDTSSPLRLEALMSQFAVSRVGSAVAFGSSTFEQVDVGEYRADGSGVSFREGEDGILYATRGGSGSYRQAASWELMIPNAVFLVGTLGALLLAALVGARRTSGSVRWLMLGVAGSSLAFVIALGYGLATTAVMDLFTGMPATIAVAQLSVVGALVLGAATASSAVVAYRNGGLARSGLAWSLIAAAGAVGLFGWAWMWSVLPG